MMEKIKLRLKELRLENNLTQEFVASEIGVSRVVYNRYENEQRSIPLEILWVLADFYKVSVDYLIGRED